MISLTMEKSQKSLTILLKESLKRISGVKRWEIASDLHKSIQEFAEVGKMYGAKRAN